MRRTWTRVPAILLVSLLCGGLFVPRARAFDAAALTAALASLEAGADGRLGVGLADRRGLPLFAYRGDEAFPFCSTFKVLLVAAVLDRTRTEPGLLEERVTYGEKDLLAYAPVAREHLAEGLTIAELCVAALQVSDNTAANLLLARLGGPAAVNRLARSLGDPAFRLDRIEPDLNTALPGDARDTTTPLSMAASLAKLAFGDVLAPPLRERLLEWMRGNTTGNASIRAGVPAGWTVGDKTGSGDYGTTNDIAVLWPPQGEPVVLALYFTQGTPEAKPRKDVLAAATGLVTSALSSAAAAQ